MNITLLTPKFTNYTAQRRENSHNSTPVMHSKLSPLSADTISFTGAKDKAAKAVKKQVESKAVTLLDFIGARYEEQEVPRFERISELYHNTLLAAAKKLTKYGFDYDEAYNSQCPIKSTSSYISKMKRSKSFQVLDPIRGTLYCKDPYNLDNLLALLKEMKEAGYIPYKTDVPLAKLLKRGYIPTVEDLQNPAQTVKVTDLDLRLNNKQLDVENMPAALRPFVSGPLKSGLEDIQLRFIRTCDINSQNPVYHELLIMFGPHSTIAKHQEHRDVYQWVRLFDEFEVPLEETSLQTHSGKALTYMERISEMFRGKVSQKLFLNAKNKDCLGIQEESRIVFTEEDLNLFRGYFNGLNDRLLSVYKSLGRSQEVKEMKSRDFERLATIREGLKATINLYNAKAGLPLLGD